MDILIISLQQIYEGMNDTIIKNYHLYFTDEASGTGRLSDSPRVTRPVTVRAGTGTEFLKPSLVLGLLAHAVCV